MSKKEICLWMEALVHRMHHCKREEQAFYRKWYWDLNHQLNPMGFLR